MALGLPFSFSFLDERKGGKRKSRRQGRQPNLPGTGRGRQHPPPLNGLMRSVIQVCGSAVGARGVGEERYGARLGLK